MAWAEVCETSAMIPGEMKSMEIGGIPITVCVVDGQYYAFSTTCTHENVSLADGYLEGAEVECPLHGARFDVRTGRCLCPPATKDLPTFLTKVENAKLYVHIG